MKIQKKASLHEKTVQALAEGKLTKVAPMSTKALLGRQKALKTAPRAIEPVDLLQMAIEIIINEEGSTYTTYEILSPTSARIT
jgi:hypothetical protein